MSKKFFCQVYDGKTKEVLAEYSGVEAIDWYYARHIVAQRFEREKPWMKHSDWYVDSCEED